MPRGRWRMRVLLSLEIEGLPPSVNQMYRTGRWSARYKKAETLRYQEGVTEHMRQHWRGKLACETPVELRITFTTSNRRRWDIDNRVKALQDCLSMAGVIKDDSQIETLHVERKSGSKDSTYIEVMSKYQ